MQLLAFALLLFLYIYGARATFVPSAELGSSLQAIVTDGVYTACDNYAMLVLSSGTAGAVDLFYTGIATSCGGACLPQAVLPRAQDGKLVDASATMLPARARGLFFASAVSTDFHGDGLTDFVYSGTRSFGASSAELLYFTGQRVGSYADSSARLPAEPADGRQVPAARRRARPGVHGQLDAAAVPAVRGAVSRARVRARL